MTEGHRVIVWSVPGMSKLHTLTGHAGVIRSVCFIDATTFATASEDMTIRVWESVRGNCLCENVDHSGPVNALALSPNGKHLASGSQDRTMKVFNVGSMECIKSVHTKNSVMSVAYSSDGTVLAGVFESEMIAIDTNTADVTAKYAYHMIPRGIVIVPG